MQVREEDAPVIESAEQARRLMQTPAEQIDERDWIARGDLETFRQALWTMIHGIVSMHALRPDVGWKPDLLDQSIEGIICGWLKPKAARRMDTTQRLQE